MRIMAKHAFFLCGEDEIEPCFHQCSIHFLLLINKQTKYRYVMLNLSIFSSSSGVNTNTRHIALYKDSALMTLSREAPQPQPYEDCFFINCNCFAGQHRSFLFIHGTSLMPVNHKRVLI
jgi:hypothetical protein